jgi:hypothetical protein
MDAAGEFTGKCRIDHAVTLDPALPPEGLRHDMNPVMGFSARAAAGMAGMLMGFIQHVEAQWRESRRQLLCDEIACAHGPSFRGRPKAGMITHRQGLDSGMTAEKFALGSMALTRREADRESGHLPKSRLAGSRAAHA